MGKAFLYKQILLTNSSRKCMEISLESLYVEIGAWRVNLVLGRDTRDLHTVYILSLRP